MRSGPLPTGEGHQSTAGKLAFTESQATEIVFYLSDETIAAYLAELADRSANAAVIARRLA
jgi:hypothetical protein